MARKCCQPFKARKKFSYVLTENGQSALALLRFCNIFVFFLVSPRTGPLPLQMSGNNINWECPDRMREKRTKKHV